MAARKTDAQRLSEARRRLARPKRKEPKRQSSFQKALGAALDRLDRAERNAAASTVRVMEGYARDDAKRAKRREYGKEMNKGYGEKAPRKKSSKKKKR